MVVMMVMMTMVVMVMVMMMMVKMMMMDPNLACLRYPSPCSDSGCAGSEGWILYSCFFVSYHSYKFPP